MSDRLTVAEAAKEAGVSRQGILEAITRKRLDADTVPRPCGNHKEYRIDRQSLLAYIERRRRLGHDRKAMPGTAHGDLKQARRKRFAEVAARIKPLREAMAPDEVAHLICADDGDDEGNGHYVWIPPAKSDIPLRPGDRLIATFLGGDLAEHEDRTYSREKWELDATKQLALNP